jgi:hypothetical protein
MLWYSVRQSFYPTEDAVSGPNDRIWQQSLSRALRGLDPSIWQAVDPTIWQRNLTQTLRGLNPSIWQAVDPTIWQRNLTQTLQTLASPAWEEIVFRALHELDAGEGNAECATWWLELPLRIRTAVITSVVWTYVFILLSTLSFEHQAEAAILRDNTGLNPVELAGAAAVLAGMVYQHFAKPDDL